MNYIVILMSFTAIFPSIGYDRTRCPQNPKSRYLSIYFLLASCTHYTYINLWLMLNRGLEIYRNQTSAFFAFYVVKVTNTSECITNTLNLFSQEIAKHLQRQEKAKAERRREKQLRRVQNLAERDEVRYCILV